MVRGVPPTYVQLSQGEANVSHAVCSEYTHDTAYVEVGPVVRLLRAGAGISVLAANAWFLVWASASPLAGFGVSPFPGGLCWSGRRLFRIGLVVGLMARASCTSGSEVGVRDLLRSGFSAACPEGGFKFILSGDGFFAILAELAAIDVRWQAGRRFGVVLGFRLMRDTSLGSGRSCSTANAGKTAVACLVGVTIFPAGPPFLAG